MRVHQARSDELMPRSGWTQPTLLCELASGIIEAKNATLIEQNCSSANRLPCTLKDLDRIEQYRWIHGFRERLQPFGQSRFRSGR